MTNALKHQGNFIPKLFTRKAHWSVVSSMILLVGLPAPWPALVSMRINTGAGPAWAACKVAANLKLWTGKTRSSWSAVTIKVGGYLAPGLMLCSGEYL